MKTCPNCGSEQANEDIISCHQCGYLFDKSSGFSSDTPAVIDESSDFIVTEALDDDREFVGGKKILTSTIDDDLGIETTTDLMEQEALTEIQKNKKQSNLINSELQPIGESTPPPPPVADYSIESGNKNNIDNSYKTERANQSGKVKKLSAEELKNIEQNLYSSNNYLSDKDKTDLIKKIDKVAEKPFSNTPITPPKKESTEKPSLENIKSDLPKPKIAKKGKGVAYFYKNFIQIVGAQEIYINDEMNINSREYVLKPKKINPKYIIGAAASLFTIILLIIGSFFVSDVDSGVGDIVGVVLDKNNRPFIEGATINFPELSKSVKSNPQGFFIADNIPAGTQQIEYIIKGKTAKVDYATVSDNQLTMIIIRPETKKNYTKQKINRKRTISKKTQKEKSSTADIAASKKKESPKPTVTSERSKRLANKTSQKSSKSALSKITLAANVDGARLVVDGSVLGAGNLTFSKIKPGKHSYVVSIDGYNPVKGSFTLSPGENKKLKVNLTPMKQKQKEEKFKTKDYYYSGKTAYKKGDYNTAVSDLTKVIDKQPSNADAYFYRGGAYSKLKMFTEAHDDFIRAAEISQFKKNYNKAITCYNEAISSDEKSITAYLGRGNLYLSKGEALAAIGDFDKVLKLDKRNFQAYYGLGEAKFKRGRYKKAIKHFKNARSIDSKNPLVHQYLMLSYLAVDDYKNVKKSFNKFSDIATEDQMRRFVSDKKYVAVLKIVESK